MNRPEAHLGSGPRAGAPAERPVPAGATPDASLGSGPRADPSPKPKRRMPASVRAAFGFAEDDPLLPLIEQVWAEYPLPGKA